MTREELLRRYPRATEDFLALNEDHGPIRVGDVVHTPLGPGVVVPPMCGSSSILKPRIRQSHRQPNKTEAALADYLRATIPGCTLYEQSLTFALANGVRYTPDIVTVDDEGGWQAWEAKGYARDDAIVKLKVAASKYPALKWWLCTRRARTVLAGGWQIEEVVP